jgi:hypothetical protein
MSLVLLYGCGGGGGLIPPTPTPNPPSPGYRVTVTLNMNQVYEGEEVTCTAEVSPSSVQAEVRWRQEPDSPSGVFSPLSGSVVRWRAPLVEKATSFSLIACVVVQGRTYEGSASIVVLDRSEPPQEPPRISISYPVDDGKQNLVGEGTLLTIMGNVQAGSNPIKKIQILEGSKVLQEWPISSSGSFRVDLSSFGSPGKKTIRVRVVDSAGLYSETSIPVVNDDAQLDSAARQFLRRYSCAGDGGTIRFGSLQTGPYAKPVEIWLFQGVEPYQNLVESAAQFWTKYTGIQFKILRHDQHPSEDVYITICDRFSEDPGQVAITQRSFESDPHEITYVRVNLYKGWLGYPDTLKVDVLSHELGHALLTEQHIDEYGQWFVMSTWGGNAVRLLPCIAQKATRLLYEHAPGWKP